MCIIERVCSVRFFRSTLRPEFSKYRFNTNKNLSLRIQQEAESVHHPVSSFPVKGVSYILMQGNKPFQINPSLEVVG